MTRIIPLAVALAASTALISVSSLALAQQTLYRWKWEGAMRIIQESPDCDGRFVSDDNIRAIYQPDLADDVDDRQSSLTIFRKTGTEMIQNYNSGQFSGTGVYIRFTIADGHANDDDWGTFTFVQTPASVTASTQFVTLVGNLTNYAGITDCTVRLRGTFVAVDSEEPSPPPPYGN